MYYTGLCHQRETDGRVGSEAPIVGVKPLTATPTRKPINDFVSTIAAAATTVQSCVCLLPS